jgi:hypothetical protein
MELAFGFLTVVVTSLIPIPFSMCIKAVPVDFPLLSCIQHNSQGYCANQLFSNSILMCRDDLLLICITSA